MNNGQQYIDLYSDFHLSIKKKMENIQNLPAVAFGVLETELMILEYFFLKYICCAHSKKYVYYRNHTIKTILNYILVNRAEELNKLFKISQFELKLLLLSRLKYYKNSISRNSEITVFMLCFSYILQSDEEIFKDNTKPFAAQDLISKIEIKNKNANYNEYGDLNKINNDYELFLNVFATESKNLENKLSSVWDGLIKEKEDYINSQEYKEQRKTKIIDIVIWLIFISIFTIAFMFGIYAETHKTDYNIHENIKNNENLKEDSKEEFNKYTKEDAIPDTKTEVIGEKTDPKEAMREALIEAYEAYENNIKNDKIEKNKVTNSQSEPAASESPNHITARVLIGTFESFEAARAAESEIKTNDLVPMPFIRKIADKYSLQVGIYKDYHTAEVQVRELKALGYDAWIDLQ